MGQKASDYHIRVNRLIAVPFLMVLFICLIFYTLIDLSRDVNKELAQANKINYLLAQSAATGNPTVMTNDINLLLSEMPQFESIMFFPINQQQHPSPHPLSLNDMLFKQYYGLSQPVKINLPAANSKANQVIGYINITLDLQYIRRDWLSQHLPLVLIFLFMGALNLGFVLIRVQRLTQRLVALEDVSRHILHDEFDQADFSVKASDNNSWVFEKALVYLLNKRKTQMTQIDRLHQEKNCMQATHLQQIEQGSRFENMLIHEFKSSVNRIESGLQLLQNQYISTEQKDAIDIINLGKDDLNTKLDQIIQIKRINKGQTGVSAYQFSPTSLLTQLVADYKPVAEQKKLTIATKTYHADYVLEGDIQKITLVIGSLLENAIKFTPKGHITITSQLHHLQTQVRWVVQIADTGIGIAHEYLEQIFEPFFQINPEVKHTASSQSVGLFLVKKLVELMKGEISVSSEPDIGTTFQVSLLLKDWKNNYERNLLIDKHIAIWYSHNDVQEKTKRISNAGAIVEAFTNSDLLEEYLLNHSVDALFISRNIHYEEMLKFVSKLRDIETKGRVVIICVYDIKNMNPHTIESLKIAGVDYFVKQEVINETSDPYLKILSNLLN